MPLSTGESYYRQSVRWRPTLTAGGLAGLIASIPMGLVMISLNRLLTPGRNAPEPPKQITAEIAGRAGVDEVVPEGKRWGLSTWLGHLGYGALTASLYPLTTYRLPMPSAASGMLFALLIWFGSYQGWLPAFNILPPASRQPSHRNAVMIGSHLLWGSLLGLLINQLKPKELSRHQEVIID